MTIKFSPRKAHFINAFADRVIQLSCGLNPEFQAAPTPTLTPFLIRMFSGQIYQPVPQAHKNIIKQSNDLSPLTKHDHFYYIGKKYDAYMPFLYKPFSHKPFSHVLTSSILNNPLLFSCGSNNEEFDLHCLVHEYHSNLNTLPSKMWLNWINDLSIHNKTDFDNDWQMMITQLQTQFLQKMELSEFISNGYDCYSLLAQRHFPKFKMPYLLKTIDTSYLVSTLDNVDDELKAIHNKVDLDPLSCLPQEWMTFITKAKTIFSCEYLQEAALGKHNISNLSTHFLLLHPNILLDEFKNAQPYLLHPASTSRTSSYRQRRAMFKEWMNFWLEEQRLLKMCMFFRHNTQIPPYILFEMVELFAIQVLSTEDSIIFQDSYAHNADLLIDELLNTTKINQTSISLNMPRLPMAGHVI